MNDECLKPDFRRPIRYKCDIEGAVEEVINYFNIKSVYKVDLIRIEIEEQIDILGIAVKVYVSIPICDIDRIKQYLVAELQNYFYGRICFARNIDIQLFCEIKQDPVLQEFVLAFENQKEDKNMRQIPEIKNLIHSGEYTHIIWEDGTKTSVKREANTPYDAYGAFAQAVLKKLYGSTEKAKFEHTLKQLPAKEQKKVLAEKEARKAKQEKAEKKKIDRQLAKEEKELQEKEEQVKKTRAKRRELFKSGQEG